MIDPSIPLIAIVGSTASGKTELAIGLAEAYNGEIICADSRTIYRGMDIGTAKPTADERSRVRHHLLDIIDPNQRLSVAEFKQLAESTISDIHNRGKVPFLVGGSGLYIDSILYDYTFASEADPKLRTKLDGMSSEELIELLHESDPEAFETIDKAKSSAIDPGY